MAEGEVSDVGAETPCLGWSSRIVASMLDEMIVFGGSFRYDPDVELTMFCGSLRAVVDPMPSTHDDPCHAGYVTIATAVAYAWDGDLSGDPAGFFDCVDAISADTCLVGELVLKWMEDQDEDLLELAFRRVIVLDSVEVAPALRGRGLGQRVAAYIAHAAGAWTDGVLVAAINGSRERNDPRVAPAAAGLCAGLGLERYGSTSLWTGSTSTSPLYEQMETLLSLSGAPVHFMP